MNWKPYSIASLAGYFPQREDKFDSERLILVTCQGEYSPYVIPARYLQDDEVVIRYCSRNRVTDPIISWCDWPSPSIPGIDHA